jgi:hypothetical protein
VLSGGYGVFYAYLEPYGDAEWLVGNPPDAFGVTLTSSPTVPALILAQGPAPGALTLAKASGVTLSSIERQANSSYGQQWNFNIQREFARDWMLEAGYAGSKGSHVENEWTKTTPRPAPAPWMPSGRIGPL